MQLWNARNPNRSRPLALGCPESHGPLRGPRGLATQNASQARWPRCFQKLCCFPIRAVCRPGSPPSHFLTVAGRVLTHPWPCLPHTCPAAPLTGRAAVASSRPGASSDLLYSPRLTRLTDQRRTRRAEELTAYLHSTTSFPALKNIRMITAQSSQSCWGN